MSKKKNPAAASPKSIMSVYCGQEHLGDIVGRDADGNLVGTFRNQRDAARALPINNKGNAS
jgi:hypothetical protein